MEPKIWSVTDGEGHTIAGGTDEQAIRQEYDACAYAVRRGVMQPPITLYQGNRVIEENADPNDAWSAKEACSRLALQQAANIIAAAGRDGSTSLTHAEACFETLQHFPVRYQHWNGKILEAIGHKRNWGMTKGYKWTVARVAIEAMLDRIDSVLPPGLSPAESAPYFKQPIDGYVWGALETCLALLQSLSGHALSDIDATIGLTVLVNAFKTARWNDPKFKLPPDSIDIVVGHFMEMPAPEPK